MLPNRSYALKSKHTFKIKSGKVRSVPKGQTSMSNYQRALRTVKVQTFNLAQIPRKFNADALRRQVATPDTYLGWDKKRNANGVIESTPFEFGTKNPLILKARINVIDYLLTIPSGAAPYQKIHKMLLSKGFTYVQTRHAIEHLIDLGAIEPHSPRWFFITPHWEKK